MVADPAAAVAAAAAAAAAAVAESPPLRSVLYVPASNARAVAKVRSPEVEADAVILDLEDAVAPEAKAAARAAAVAAVAAGGWGDKRVIVRVNGIGTPWYEDDVAAVAALAGGGGEGAKTLAGVLLPKCESAVHVVSLSEALPPSLPIWAMVETPRGVLAAADIASATERTNLCALVAGTTDLTADLRAMHTRDRAPLLASLSTILLAARAYGLLALDGVPLDLTDAEGLAATSRQGRALGFDGRTIIHPSQTAAVHAAYSPSAADVARSRAIVEAHTAAAAKGSGVAVLDGKLVEAMHVAEAHRVVAIANLLVQRAAQRAAALAAAAATPAAPVAAPATAAAPVTPPPS